MDSNSVKNDKNIMEIKDGKKILAVFYSKNIKASGVRFLTPLNYPLQVGLIEHENGKNVPLHIHRNMRYKVNTTQELIYIEKGRIHVIVANKKWQVKKKLILTRGDFILFVSGAHGIDIKKGSRLIEIKQGPYPGDSYAKIFKK